MYKALILLLAALLLTSSSGYCASRTVSFQLMVVMPPHVMPSTMASAPVYQANVNQFVQTDTIVRNNREVRVTSVVPT